MSWSLLESQLVRLGSGLLYNVRLSSGHHPTDGLLRHRVQLQLHIIRAINSWLPMVSMSVSRAVRAKTNPNAHHTHTAPKDDQFSRLSPMFYYMKFRIGICIPSTCVDSDLESISGALSSSLRLNITIPHCRINQSQPITLHQLVGGLTFGAVLVAVICASLMDFSRRKLDSSESGQEIVMLRVANLGPGKDKEKSTIEMPVRLINPHRSSSPTGLNFIKRLDHHWTWMSFSCLANYRLYFKHKRLPQLESRHQQQQQRTQRTAQASGTPQPAAYNSGSHMIVSCLNGIRVLSLCWVIVANSYITLDPRATKRLTKTREAPKDFLFQMVAQASLAIETFFFLSGVLMSLSFARRLGPDAGNWKKAEVRPHQQEEEEKVEGTKQQQWRRKGKTLEWIHFYLHRYVRMTPATMLVIAFTMFAFRYGDGPLWFEATHKAHQSCSENWWRHLLHVANFIDTRQMCFIHYWYIAADMQLFIVAPLLLFLLYRHRLLGYSLAALIGLMSVGSVFYTTYNRNLPPTLLFYNSDPE